MIYAKLIAFVFCCSLFIIISNYNQPLHDHKEFIFGESIPRKKPSRSLNVITIAFIVIGSAIAAFSLPETKVGLTLGTILGTIILTIAGIVRFESYN